MAKIFNYYADNVDYAWYDSSNIVYSECIDHVDALKELKVVFSNGTQYIYRDVNVNDYLLFREDKSQGKALNRLIKANSYPYEKLDNADLDAINEELIERTQNGFFIYNDDNGFRITNTTDEVVFSEENKYDDDYLNNILSILGSVGVKFIVKKP